MVENSNTPSKWSVEKKAFTVTAEFKCSFCNTKFTRSRQSSVSGQHVESEQEVLGNMTLGAQNEHFDCLMKNGKKNTISIVKKSRS